MSTLKERLIAGATIIGSVFACFAVGYSVGKDTNDGLLNFLREKNQASEKIEAQLHAEISALKLEIQSKEFTQRPQSTPSSGQQSSPQASAPRAAQTPQTERVSLNPGQSINVFGGELIISLIQVDFSDAPLRHKAIATVGAPGQQNKLLDKVDVGYSITVAGFDVRVVRTGFQSATFLVTKLETKT